MRKINKLLILILCNCSCGIYRQNVVNVPAITQKGQLQLSVHQSFNGSEIHGSYSVTNNIALMVNYGSIGNDEENNSGNKIVQNHYFKEIGLGFYKPSAPNNNQTIKEIFAIAGQGYTSKYTETYVGSKTQIYFKEAFYNRFGIQIDYGKKTYESSWFISPRLLYIDYFGIKDTTTITSRQQANSFIRGEVAFTYRYHFNPYISLSGQSCITVPITDYLDNIVYDDFSVLNASIGLAINLNLFKFKPNK